LLVAIIVTIFFLLAMQRALNQVSPRNRLMEPGMVWLLLVPCVNFVWQFLIAIRVPDSLKNEFSDRGRDDGSDYGKTLGLTYCIVGIVNMIISNGLGLTPDVTVNLIVNGISLLVSLMNLVIGIMFWIKIVGYTNQLASDDFDRPGRRGPLDDFDDDDDYSRRKARSEPSEGIQEGDGL